MPNYHVPDVEDALATLGVAGLPERLVIDASHDNSGKDPEKQFFAAGDIADQIADGNKAIVGVMLESFLVEGRQDLGPGEQLTYGQSITDACIDWERHGRGARAASPRRSRPAAQLSWRPGDEGRRPRRGPDRRLDRARRAASGSGPRWSASAADPETVARGASSSGAIDRGAGSVAEACEGAEVVFCAAPVGALPELAREALAAAGPDAVVTDVGSTKRELVAALGGDERFIGGHPLAGAETAGVENARADLFEGARWYLTPTERSSGVLYDRLQRVVAGLGARPQAIDAAAHDRLMATVSHLPHVVANVLVAEAAAALAATPSALPEVGPSFRDTTRVAGANPAIWADIFASNREAVADAVDAGRAAPAARRRR